MKKLLVVLSLAMLCSQIVLEGKGGNKEREKCNEKAESHPTYTIEIFNNTSMPIAGYLYQTRDEFNYTDTKPRLDGIKTVKKQVTKTCPSSFQGSAPFFLHPGNKITILTKYRITKIFAWASKDYTKNSSVFYNEDVNLKKINKDTKVTLEFNYKDYKLNVSVQE